MAELRVSYKERIADYHITEIRFGLSDFICRLMLFVYNWYVISMCFTCMIAFLQPPWVDLLVLGVELVS